MCSRGSRSWETAHIVSVVALSISIAPPWYLIPGDVDVRLGDDYVVAAPVVILLFAIALVVASLWVARAAPSSRQLPALRQTALLSVFGVSALLTVAPIGITVTDGPAYEPYTRAAAAVLVLAAGWLGSGRGGAEQKYARSGLTRIQTDRLFEVLGRMMEADRPYLDPELTLNALAARLGTSPNVLSQVINQTTGAGFRNYVAACRIEHFKRRAKGGDLHDTTILALAMDCGFRSKSAFNDAFRRLEGKTPRDFLRSLERKGPTR